jgi:hypothetical protein
VSATVCFGFLVMFCSGMEAPAPKKITTVVCPSISAWDKSFQAKLLVEYDALPADSQARIVVQQHIRLREKIRRCRQGK